MTVKGRLPPGAPEIGERPRRSLWPVFFMILGLVLPFAYLLTPPYIQRALCPSDAFIWEHFGSRIGVLGVLLVFPSCFALAFCMASSSVAYSRSPARSANVWRHIQKYSSVYAFVAVLALTIALVSWLSVVFSFFCATPYKIIFHTGIQDPNREYTWADVTAVHAACWGGSRTPWQGGLTLSFIDGQEALLPLGDGRGIYGWMEVKKNYDAIAAALQGKNYVYDLSRVTHCTNNVYTMLLNWPDELRYDRMTGQWIPARQAQ
jgi:hypothetical protein